MDSNFEHWIKTQPIGFVNLMYDAFRASQSGEYKVEIKLKPRFPITKTEIASFDQIVKEATSLSDILDRLS